MDGTHGGTTFTDEQGSTVTVGGAVTTTTSVKQFGTAGGDFPGANADLLSLPNSGDMNFGTGNLTIEGWFKCTTTSRQYMTLCEKDNGAFGVGSWSLIINHAAATDGLLAFYLRDFHATNALLITTVTAYNDNVFHHVAVVRNGNQWIMFVDGVLKIGATSAVTVTDLAVATLLGNSVYVSRGWTGTLDEWRITKGQARYTVAFTAPTAAFPGTFDDGTHVGATGATGAAGLSLAGEPGPAGADGKGSTVILPRPPEKYDVNDQRQARRLIEQAFR